MILCELIEPIKINLERIVYHDIYNIAKNIEAIWKNLNDDKESLVHFHERSVFNDFIVELKSLLNNLCTDKFNEEKAEAALAERTRKDEQAQELHELKQTNSLLLSQIQELKSTVKDQKSLITGLFNDNESLTTKNSYFKKITEAQNKEINRLRKELALKANQLRTPTGTNGPTKLFKAYLY